MDSNYQGNSDYPLSVSRIFEEIGVEEDDEFNHTNDKKRILDVAEKKIKSGDQMLFFSHGAAGARKSTVMQKVKDLEHM